MDTHYPQNTESKPTVFQNQLKIELSDLQYLYETWLSTDKIRLALNSFKDKKTPGPDGMKPIVFKHFSNNILLQLQTNLMEGSQSGLHTKTW